MPTSTRSGGGRRSEEADVGYRWVRSAAAAAALLAVVSCSSGEPATSSSSSAENATPSSGDITSGSSTAPTSSAPIALVGPSEGALVLAAPPDYLAGEWRSEYEISTGCSVELVPVALGDDLASLLAQGTIDGVVAPPATAFQLMMAGLVSPIDETLLPNFAGLAPELAGAAWSTVANVAYAVPHARHDLEIDTYGDLPDDPLALGIVASSLGGALGITDPFVLNDDQFAATVDALGAAGPDTELSVDSRFAWSESWMISSTARHPNCMYAWMNQVLDADVNPDAAAAVGGSTVLGASNPSEPVVWLGERAAACVAPDCVEYARWAEAWRTTQVASSGS